MSHNVLILQIQTSNLAQEFIQLTRMTYNLWMPQVDTS